MDTMNKFIVGVRGGKYCIQNVAALQNMTKEDVLLLCGWLLIISAQETDEVVKVCDEIMAAG